MIILRRKRKLFAYRDPDPSKYMFDLSDYVYIDKSGNFHGPKIKIQETKKYKKQIKKCPEPLKSIIKKIRKGLKNGYFYTNQPKSSEDTHSLGRDTSKYKNRKLESVVWSKKINTMDRFNYRIYRPKFNQSTKEYIMKIVLESCRGHELNGRFTYSKLKLFSKIIKILKKIKR